MKPSEHPHWSRFTAPVSGTPQATPHRGVALLSAMLTVTLVATFAATALWQQWRSVEVETAERARVQAGWILTGALDWARLILREDARAGGVDHLAEPWAVPLNEARLSSFLSVDKNASDTERDAFLSGQVSDLQGRLNIANLIDGQAVSESGMTSFSRLFALLGLPPEQLQVLASNLLAASQNVKPGGDQNASPASALPSPLMPQRVDELVWLGLTPASLAALGPHVSLLPVRTTVNINTASVEVLYASTPDLPMADAQKVVAARQRSHFRTLADAAPLSSGRAGPFTEVLHTVSSRFFEVRGSLRLDQTTMQERSVLQRDGLSVRTLWRSRGMLVADSQGVAP